MKRTAYLGFFAGMLLTGCIAGDYGVKPADPQSWEQEEAVTLPGLTISAAAPVDLAKVEADSVAIASLGSITLPEGAEFGKLVIVLDDVEKIPVDISMKASVASLQAAVEKLYGKRPVAREFSGRLNADVMVDGQASLLVSNEVNVTLTPEAPFISSAYWLVGDMCGWDKATAVAFSHSDADVYSDPVFTIKFETPKNDCYWKLIPQGNYEGDFWSEGPEGVVGVAVDGDPAMSGNLTVEKPQAGKIEAAGKYILTINMMEYTYELQSVVDNYYLVGTLQGQVASAPNTNGWYDSVDYMNCLLYPAGDDVYVYTSMFSDGGYAGYKIWNEKDYGNWDLCYGTAVNNDNSPSGNLVNTGAGSICLPTTSKDDIYTITVDMAGKTYSTEKYSGTVARYEAVGIIGGFNGWGGDVDMTEVSQHNWCAKDVKMAEETEFKFRADHKWDTSWGSGENVSKTLCGVAADNGGNMTIAAGTYDFYFNSLTGHFAIVAK